VKYCVLLSVILCYLYGYAQQNPFRSPSPAPDTIRNQSASPQRSYVPRKKMVWKYLPFSRTLLSLQRDLSAKLSHRLRKIKERPNPAAIAGLLILAFLYGIIHSLGPGHAKALFVSHGLTRATPLRSTWVAGCFFIYPHRLFHAAVFRGEGGARGWTCGKRDVFGPFYGTRRRVDHGGRRDHHFFLDDRKSSPFPCRQTAAPIFKSADGRRHGGNSSLSGGFSYTFIFEYCRNSPCRSSGGYSGFRRNGDYRKRRGNGGKHRRQNYRPSR
jgi:hypothetical protein